MKKEPCFCEQGYIFEIMLPTAVKALFLLAAAPIALGLKPRPHGECLRSNAFTNPSVPAFKHFFIQSPDTVDGSRSVNVSASC